ncbi:hypothetical protein HON49_04020 [archaeon]|nr:hypothetical protein [archaeon]
MNKTTVKILQEIIRDPLFSIANASTKFKKAPTTIYDCTTKLRKLKILSNKNKLLNNELTTAYKKLFITHPYDFSFLTKNNIQILKHMLKEITFQELIIKSKKSRFTVNQLIKNLKQRGFANKQNKIIEPKELIKTIKTIIKYEQNNIIDLPPSAITIYHCKDRNIIQTTKETKLNLNKTSFSAFKFKIITPRNYYTTLKKISIRKIFNDAEKTSKNKREHLLTAMYYYKNRKKLRKNKFYDELIKTEEFQELKKEYA